MDLTLNLFTLQTCVRLPGSCLQVESFLCVILGPFQFLRGRLELSHRCKCGQKRLLDNC